MRFLKPFFGVLEGPMAFAVPTEGKRVKAAGWSSPPPMNRNSLLITVYNKMSASEPRDKNL